MKKTDIINGLSYLEVPEVDLRILCGCPENSIKFIMQQGLTPAVQVNNINLVSGPNAILLNDYTVHNSYFLNFAEFPVLHQQYFQGAAFNGTDEKFILIGDQNKINHQYEYIRRGLQGLLSKEEMLNAGVEGSVADKFVAITNYHRGFEKNFNILDKLPLHGKTHVRGDLYVKRVRINLFEFTYQDQKEIIDLNLKENFKGIGLPYNLESKPVAFDDFSVTTIGDGNGWNPHVPCMGAFITAKGNRFLVDSGPGSYDLIRTLGTSPSEIDGVFVTHSHDDHFAGILSLLRSDSKVKFFSTAVVAASVEKKFEALLHLSREHLRQYIDFIILRENEWTDIGEMEVNPKYSFHTVETNIFYFRSKNSSGEWKVYGHIADIISRKDLNYMVDHDPSGCITHDWADVWFNKYLEPADLKRIDAGGGVVHGDSKDFSDDKSSKIILSHLNTKIELEANSKFSGPTEFGHTEVLISSDENYLVTKAESILKEIDFIPQELSNSLSADNIYQSKPDEVLLKKGEKIIYLYLVLSGIVESIDSVGHLRKYVKGDFLYSFDNEKTNRFDYISNTYCSLYKIKLKDMIVFNKQIKPNSNFKMLRGCSYFAYGFSYEKLLALSKVVSSLKIKKDKLLELDQDYCFIVYDGSIGLVKSGTHIKSFRRGQMYSYHNDQRITLNADENSIIILFNRKDIINFTSLLWSCFEECSKIETIVEIGN